MPVSTTIDPDRAMATRELRALVPVEVTAVLAVVLWYLVATVEIPPVVPLLIAASLARWVRGRGWGEVVGGGWLHVGIGLAAGAVALAIALLVATPAIEAASDRAIQ